MVTVHEIHGDGDVWEVQLAIRDGVYRIDRYPVRVEGVPLAPGDLDAAGQQEVVARFVVEHVTRHMRRGSLPPHGTRLNGQSVWTDAPSDAPPIAVH